MPARPPSSSDSLLELLDLLARGPLSAKQIAAALGRHFDGLVNAAHLALALDALQAESLIESQVARGELVYRATSLGLRALEQRGRYPGMVVIVFTDLVDSTRLIEALGDAAADRLRQHFSLLREAIARHGGREVKSLGDGLMVVFGDACAAMRCAAAMQRAAARDRDRLGLRIGIHAGEPAREGDDYFGTPVIIARRLCDAAHAGQILISLPARELIDEPGLSELEPLGALSLKGLSEPVTASAVPWALTDEMTGAPMVSRNGLSSRLTRAAAA
jgi:class 3 adenylate cyclase